VGRVLGQGLAGVVVLGRDLEFLHQRQRLLVHRLMVAHHVFGKGLDFLVAGFLQGLFRRRDVDHTGGVGDMRNLRIGRFGALCEGGAAQQANRGDRRAQSNEHDLILLCCRDPGAVGRVGCTGWMVRERKGSGKIYRVRPRRCRTAAVRRSQRLPANGNASITTGPIFLSTLSRSMVRARCSLVFTVSGFSPRISAVSSTFMPSITRVMKTMRNASGSSSMARSTTCWISRCAIDFSGSSDAAERGNWMIW